MNIVLIAITLALVLIAVVLLVQNVYIWDAVLLLSLAMIAFIITLVVNKDSHATLRDDLKRMVPRQKNVWLRSIPVLTSFLVAINAKAMPAQSDFTLALLFWTVAVIGFCVSLVIPWIQQRDTSGQISKPEWMALLVLMIAATVCRGAGLGHIPANLGGDEGTQLLLGVDLVAAP
ncbi:MAG: hypothetical protein E4H27_02215, partial [Anaerolineales bacterium]